MSTHPVLGKPPKPPNPKPAPSGGHSEDSQGSYVSRFHRLRGLNQQKNVSSDIHKMIQKSLPKISGGEPDRSRAVVRGLGQTTEANVTSLPGVQTRDASQKQPVSPRRKSLPMKTFHFRVNPDHSSFISKSLPSLPSIPGSPSYPEDQAVSPLTDRGLPTDRDKPKVPIFPSKHCFEKIVVRKHLHGETASEEPASGWEKPHRLPLKPALKTTGSNNSRPQQADSQRTARIGWAAAGAGHSEHGHGHNGHLEERPKAQTSGSVRIRYSQMPAQRVVSATQSEPAFEVSRKWKEDCSCLRCQMLKRQYQEGDAHYQLWGRYPCHHVDPSVMLDD